MLLILLACRPPEAPDTFEEMMVYGFAHAQDEDPDALVALGDKLIPWVEANFEQTTEGYEIAPLTNEALAEAGVDVTVEEAILGAAVGQMFTGDLSLLTAGLTWPRLDEIYSQFVDFSRVAHTDRDCFLSGACAQHEVTDDVHSSVALGIELWDEYDVGFRNITLTDGSPALVRWQVGTDPVEFSTELFAVYQQYGFDFSYPAADGTARRVQAMWADGELLSGDLAEGFYLTITINAMASNAEELDAWMASR